MTLLPRLPAAFDALRTPQVPASTWSGLVAASRTIFGVIGDSNAAGFDNGTADWRPRIALPGFTSRTSVAGYGVWNKWTNGASANRSSAADTGTTFRPFELGFGGSPAGTGQFITGIGAEAAIAEALQTAIPALSQTQRNTMDLGCLKYGISGAVVHGNPVNPATGWSPSGAANGCFKIFANYYVRPALAWLEGEWGPLGSDNGPVYYAGTVCFLGGTDAIDPAGVFTEPGDAEAVDGNIQRVVQGLHDWLGVPRAMTVLAVPPRVNLAAASNLGYPNMPLVQDRVRQLAARRSAAGYRTVAVELGDCERIADNLHYSNFGQWTAGTLIGEAMVRAGLLLHRIPAMPEAIV